VLTTPDRCAADRRVTGRGVTIAFIDSGFYPHPDLAGRVIVQIDAESEQFTPARRYDEPSGDSWHGQMTSVIAAGNGADYPGIACGAKLVLIKVSNRRHQIKEKDILRGLTWLLDNHRRYGIRVANISVGGDFESFDPAHPLHRAIAQLVAEGVVVCVAAGNSARPHLVPPSSAPDAITVGGYNDHNTRDQSRWEIYHSNWGRSYDGTAKPELLTPALWIASPVLAGTAMARRAPWLARMIDADEAEVRAILRVGYADLGLTRREALYPNTLTFTWLRTHLHKDKLIDATHQHVDGTSVAVAILSSIVAQLLEIRPELTPRDVKAILMQSADYHEHWPRDRQGAGVVNPARALAYLVD